MAEQPKNNHQASAPVSDAVRREAEKILAAQAAAKKKRKALILKISAIAAAVAVLAIVAVVLDRWLYY